MTWESVALGEICWPKQHPTISGPELMSEGYPVFGANGQIGFYNRFTHDKTTIAITCRGATCGTINVVPAFSYITGNAMALDRLDEGRADIRFLARALRFRGLSDVISGSAQPQITRGPLLDVRVKLPPIPVQKRIASILDQADQLLQKRRLSIERLCSVPQALFAEMFGFPSDTWPECRLEEVVRSGSIVTYGIVQAGEEFSGGVPYIRTGDIVEGEIDCSDLRHTDPAIAAKFERSRVNAGDIVMSIRATVGTTALVPPALDGANLTQGTAKIAPGERTDPLFLLNLLRAPVTQRWIQQQVKGATFREITLGRLRDLPVRLPPLGLQRRFSTRAAEIERLRASASSHLASLDALFASLQHRAFRGELTSKIAERELAEAS